MGKKLIIFCKICGKEFSSYQSHNRKFCSRECFNIYYKNIDRTNWKNPPISLKKSSKHIEKECVWCKKIFDSLICKNQKYCCTECKNLHQSQLNRGNGNPNWVENKKQERFKGTSNWKEWREKVFERDNYTCQFCNIKGGHLEPHHIKSKQCFPELVYEIKNGITLCKKHHRLLHKLLPANDKIRVKEYPVNILNEESK